MEVEEALAIYWLQIQKRKEEKKRNRMYRIHPILTDRSEKGLFVTLCADLRANPDKFFMFARMSISSFDALILYLENKLRKEMHMRSSISPAEKVLLTLRYISQ